MAGALMVAVPAAADPVLFDFTGSQGGATGSGSYGNTRTFTNNGVTATVTAWGYTWGSSNNALESAALGRWSSGLGACNRTEGQNCGSPEHQVDNVGADDWILITFSQAIDITSVRIDPYGNYDRDVSYWLGNVSIPLNLNGVSYSGLSSRGFGSRVDDNASNSNSARNVSIGALNGSQFVNAILIGGAYSSDQDDFFKIVSVVGNTRTTSVPEPTTLMLVGVGAIAAFRRRNRTNV